MFAKMKEGLQQAMQLTFKSQSYTLDTGHYMTFIVSVNY